MQNLQQATQQKQQKPNNKIKIEDENKIKTVNNLNFQNEKIQQNQSQQKQNGQQVKQQIQQPVIIQQKEVQLQNLQSIFEKYNIFNLQSKSMKQNDIMIDESDEYLVSYVFNRFVSQNQKSTLNQNAKLDNQNLKQQESIKNVKPQYVFNLSSFRDDQTINPVDIYGQHNIIGYIEKSQIKMNYDSMKSTKYSTSIKFAEGQSNMLATSDSEGAVILFDLVNSQQIGVLQKQSKCVSMLNWQSPFTLTASGQSNVIFNLDLRKKNYISQEFKLPQNSQVISLSWNSNKHDFICSGKNKEIYIWNNLQQKAPVFTIQNTHKSNVRALSWSNLKQNHFITGGCNEDGNLKLWDYQTQKNIYSVQTQHQITNILTPLNNKFRGNFITTYNSQNNSIEMWAESNNQTLQKQTNLLSEQNRIVFGAISQFDDKVITSSSSGNTNLWECFS